MPQTILARVVDIPGDAVRKSSRIGFEPAPEYISIFGKAPQPCPPKLLEKATGFLGKQVFIQLDQYNAIINILSGSDRQVSFGIAKVVHVSRKTENFGFILATDVQDPKKRIYIKFNTLNPTDLTALLEKNSSGRLLRYYAEPGLNGNLEATEAKLEPVIAKGNKGVSKAPPAPMNRPQRNDKGEMAKGRETPKRSTSVASAPELSDQIWFPPDKSQSRVDVVVENLPGVVVYLENDKQGLLWSAQYGLVSFRAKSDVKLGIEHTVGKAVTFSLVTYEDKQQHGRLRHEALKYQLSPRPAFQFKTVDKMNKFEVQAHKCLIVVAADDHFVGYCETLGAVVGFQRDLERDEPKPKVIFDQLRPRMIILINAIFQYLIEPILPETAFKVTSLAPFKKKEPYKVYDLQDGVFKTWFKSIKLCCGHLDKLSGDTGFVNCDVHSITKIKQYSKKVGDVPAGSLLQLLTVPLPQINTDAERDVNARLAIFCQHASESARRCSDPVEEEQEQQETPEGRTVGDAKISSASTTQSEGDHQTSADNTPDVERDGDVAAVTHDNSKIAMTQRPLVGNKKYASCVNLRPSTRGRGAPASSTGDVRSCLGVSRSSVSTDSDYQTPTGGSTTSLHSNSFFQDATSMASVNPCGSDKLPSVLTTSLATTMHWYRRDVVMFNRGTPGVDTGVSCRGIEDVLRLFVHSSEKLASMCRRNCAGVQVLIARYLYALDEGDTGGHCNGQLSNSSTKQDAWSQTPEWAPTMLREICGRFDASIRREIQVNHSDVYPWILFYSQEGPLNGRIV